TVTKHPNRKENAAMATQTLTRPQASGTEKKIQKLRELYADAPELGRVALERLIDSMKGGTISELETSSAGRTGLRRGKVSELTIVFPIAKGAAERLMAVLHSAFSLQAPRSHSTVHDHRCEFTATAPRL